MDAWDGSGWRTKVCQNLLDNRRVIDTADDLKWPLAAGAMRDVDPKDTLQALCPRHGSTGGDGCLGFGLSLCSRRLTRVRDDARALVMVGGEDTVKTDQMMSRWWNECRKATDEIQRLEKNVGGAVAVRGLELVTNEPVGVSDSRFSEIAGRVI